MDFINENRMAIAFAFAIMLLGSAAYFWFADYEKFVQESNQFTLMKGNEQKKFAHMSPALAESLPFAEGDASAFAASEENRGGICPLIVGADEAAMMRKEGLFSGTGDRISGFFGNDVEIAGVLRKTNSRLDMLHVVSEDCEYSQA